MAYNADHGVNLGVLKNSLTRAKTEWLAAISKSGHAQYKKVDAVPEPDAAQENVLYLVKNTGTNHYDIYAKIDGAMELLDDTTVSLDDYVTEEALAEALAGVGGGALYEGTKTDLEAADSTVIEAYFTEHSETSPKAGDVFVVTTIVSGVTYEQSAYRYTGTDWAAMTGAVDADKVMLRDDFTMAGNFTQVGNFTKSANGTSTLPAKGKSVAAFLEEMLSKRLQPTITAQPSISGFALTGAKAVEAGTSLANANYTAATLNPQLHRRHPQPRLLPVRARDRRRGQQLEGGADHRPGNHPSGKPGRRIPGGRHRRQRRRRFPDRRPGRRGRCQQPEVQADRHPRRRRHRRRQPRR